MVRTMKNTKIDWKLVCPALREMCTRAPTYSKQYAMLCRHAEAANPKRSISMIIRSQQDKPKHKQQCKRPAASNTYTDVEREIDDKLSVEFGQNEM